ncbi:MAG: hypothetical protein CMD68_02555 [Gammaproteobacteria bacterium]|nr:hypothetical protein [Gammaproteobacteria bacterium]
MLSSNAEKLYWLSRYIERAENTARLVNVNFDLLLDIPHDTVSDFIHLIEITSDLEQFNSILLDEKMFYSSSVSAMKNVVLNFVIHNKDNHGSITYSLEMAKYNSRYLRTMLPKTAWEQFNNLHQEFSAINKKTHNSEALHQLIRNSKTFFSTVSDAMHRDHVFDFIKLGRFVERADMLSRIIEDQILRRDSRISKYYESLQWMSILKSINGFESFKKINKGELRRDNVLNFIFKLKEFPRSITFCIERLISVTKYLPKSDDLRNKLIKIKGRASKINQKSTDKQILELLDVFQLGLIDFHLTVEKKFF